MRPSDDTCPASGGSASPMMRTSVDFPAPFSPRMPTLLPVGKVALTSSSTTLSPAAVR